MPARRDFLRTSAAGLTSLAFSGLPRRAAAQAPRPNIVLFLVDDMGWWQVGFSDGDSTPVPTPNCDRIAAEGVNLSQFYVQPVCSPTRSCLMTGRYPWKNGMEVRPTATSAHGMLRDERTIAQALGDAGYATWMVGKWHLGEWYHEHLPCQRGFQHHYGHYSALIDSFTHQRDGVLDWHRNGQPVVEEGYSTWLLADEASKLIRDHDGNRPFFLYLPFNAVHGPHRAPVEIVEKYASAAKLSQQYAQLECMDTAVGRVMTTLADTGRDRDTLVIFVNDNGGPGNVGNEPYRGFKSSYWEGGTRVPCAVRWPDHIPAGTTSNAMLHAVDLYPTLLNLAGAKLDQPLAPDGLDAWQTISAGAASPRDEILFSREVVRRGPWKYIAPGAKYYNWDPGEPQLFNLDEDPYETTNRIADHPEVAKELEPKLEAVKAAYRKPEAPHRIPGWPVAVYGEREQAEHGERLRADGVVPPAGAKRPRQGGREE